MGTPIRPEYMNDPVLRRLVELERQVQQLAQRTAVGAISRGALSVYRPLNATDRVKVLSYGELDDGRYGQVLYDVDGSELLRVGELPDDSRGVAVYDEAGVEQSRLDANGVSVVRSGVRTNLADYIFGETTAFIASAETTTSTSYVDLATVGPSVTVTVGPSGRVRLLAGVEASTEVVNATGNHGAIFGYSASGANTIGDTYLGLHDAWSQVSAINLSRASIASGRVISGLAAGSTTFKLRYAARIQGTAGFANRWLIVQPL